MEDLVCLKDFSKFIRDNSVSFAAATEYMNQLAILLKHQTEMLTNNPVVRVKIDSCESYPQPDWEEYIVKGISNDYGTK